MTISRIFNGRKILQTLSIAFMAALLLVQAPVNAQSAALASNELKSLVSKMKTEVDRRLASTNEGIKAVEGSNLLSLEAKKTILATLTESRTALNNLKREISNVKDYESAKELATRVEGQYEQYTNSNAAAYTLKDGDTQKQAADQLESLADDAQSKIDQAGAADADVSGLQEQLKGIDQLIQSISAIIASIVALLVSLATGNFKDAAAIFQTILGQLGLNITAMDSAQNGLSGIIDSLASFEFSGSIGSAGK